MKIGILTFHDADNYGAVLQAYALKEIVKKIEKDVEIINYKQPYILNDYKIISIGKTKDINGIIKSIIISLLHLHISIIKKIKFNSFRNKYMDITKDIFLNLSDIKGKDVYVVGSDQVWNGDLTHYDKAFFLEFCTRNKKRIAYAASIGKDNITDYDWNYFRENINDIDYISLREDSAVKIIQSITEKKVYHVLDPTLLMDRSLWDEVCCRNKIKYKYILVYKLSNNEGVLKFAETIARRLNLKVICISDSIKKNRHGFKNIKRVGVTEFVALFKNASFILTDSFHGTAFSIIFNKNFITIPCEKRANRMISLLDMLKLNDRIIKSNQIGKDFLLEIDYTIPNEILKIEKEKSFTFLKEAIQG